MLKAGAVTDIQTVSTQHTIQYREYDYLPLCHFQVGWGTPLTASCLGNFHRVTEVLLAAGVDHSIGSVRHLLCARD